MWVGTQTHWFIFQMWELFAGLLLCLILKGVEMVQLQPHKPGEFPQVPQMWISMFSLLPLLLPLLF